MKTFTNICVLLIAILFLSFIAKLLLSQPILLWVIIIAALFYLTRKS